MVSQLFQNPIFKQKVAGKVVDAKFRGSQQLYQKFRKIKARHRLEMLPTF